jgi:hypothetical protein
MNISESSHQRSRSPAKKAGGLSPRRRGFLLAAIAVVAILSCSAQTGQETQSSSMDRPSQSTELDRAPGAGQPTSVRDQGTDNEKPVRSYSERQKQIAANKAKLLKLATDLKEEIDKAGTGTLSVAAIRKANEIEKLARTVRQEMNRDLKQAP